MDDEGSTGADVGASPGYPSVVAEYVHTDLSLPKTPSVTWLTNMRASLALGNDPQPGLAGTSGEAAGVES